jgi:phage shock protein C
MKGNAMFSGFDRLARLYRDPDNGIVAGVCAGIAEYVGLRPVQLRLLAILGLVFFFVPTIIGYMALALLLKSKPPDLYQADDEAEFWRQARTAPKEALFTLSERFRAFETRLGRLESLVASEEYELRRKFRDLED